MRTHAALTALALSACGPSLHAMPDGGTPPEVRPSDGGSLPDGAAPCPPSPRGCALPAGRYTPEASGEMQRVWIPAGNRYINEPTLVRDDAGTWHVFANGAEGDGGPWVETQLLHATAPSLYGPWTEQPDILTAQDPGAVEQYLHAPFVMRDGGGYRILYYDGRRPFDQGLFSARSTDLFHWTREPGFLPGGRDAMVLRLEDGRDLLYTVATVEAPDGTHDAVAVYQGRGGAAWGPQALAVRDPMPCPANCWGFYESPYVVETGGYYYLFSTWTDSDTPNYQRTVVFRSEDPTRFEPTPLTTLVAHGAEFHVENGRMFMTSGGWPHRLPGRGRGLFVTPIAWRPE